MNQGIQRTTRLLNMKLIFSSIAILLVLVASGFYYLYFWSHAVPSSNTFVLNMQEVRRYADLVPGAKPTSINAEKIASANARKALMLAASSWSKQAMGYYSFQLTFQCEGEVKDECRQGLVDTSVDYALSQQMAVPATFHPEPYERMGRAMQSAEFILLTHEHMDHVGGLSRHPEAAQIMKVSHFTEEQLSDRQQMLPAMFSDELINSAIKLTYDRLHAFGPGIVLIKAAGHSPGSQMIYVKLENRQEYLFIGDITWHGDGIKLVRPKPRLVSDRLLSENQQVVTDQLAWLHSLTKEEPELIIVIAHDTVQLEMLQRRGLLGKQFVVQ